MARTSRKQIHQQTDLAQAPKTYLGGAYRRLSVEDDRHRDRHSLENQENIILDFLKTHPDIRLVEVYTDNGETGTKFDRPDFQRMMEDVRSGKINCIIVKDLSRFARDFREAGHYLEQIFPFLGVRFISINDHYDSSDPKPDKEGIAIPATNLINELYARDISQKVKSGLKTLRSAGKFVGALAPYGYNKSPQDKHQLVVDPPAAEVIRNIFQWLLDGWSDCQIVYHLNQQGIPSPGQYRYEQGLLKHERYENCGPWNRTAIKRLVRNRVYAGDMVQGKRSSSYFSRPGPRPESDWDIVEDTHEAIVSRETFDAVQNLLKDRTDLFKKRAEKNKGLTFHQNLLRGVVYCGGCGRPMERLYYRSGRHKKGERRVYYYTCQTFTKRSKSLCARNMVSEKELREAALSTIQAQIRIAADLKRIVTEVWDSGETKDQIADMDAEIRTLRQKLARSGTLKRGIYENYIEGVLSKSQYLSAKEEYTKTEAAFQQQIDALLSQKRCLAEHLTLNNRWLKDFLNDERGMELSQKMLAGLVQRIDIFEKKRVRITLKFQDGYHLLTDHLTERAHSREKVAG